MLLNGISNNLYSSLIENNLDPIFILDNAGNVLGTNSAALDVFGYSSAELTGTNYKDILKTNEDLEKNCKMMDGEFCTYQVSTCDKEGRNLYLQVKTIPLFERDKLSNVMIVARDITEFVETKDTLRKTSERLRSIYASSADAMDILDLDGNVIQVNKAFEKMYGWKLKEIVGKPIPTIPHHRLEKVKEERRRLKSDESIKGLEVDCLKKDGTSIPISLTVSPLRDQHCNVVASLGISRDISERKALESALQESRNKYRALLNAFPEPSLVQSGGVIRYINQAAVKVFGYERPGELLGRSVLEFAHADALAWVAEATRRLSCEALIPQQTQELKLLKADRSTFIAEVTFLGIEFENKLAVHVLFRDITEKKRIEEALIRSEEKYRLIAENMTDLVTIVNGDRKVIYTSPSRINVLGVSPEESVGKQAQDNVHPDDYPEFKNFMDDLFCTQGVGELEFRYRHKTQKWIWMETKASYFVDEENGKGFLLFVSRDIEEKKRLREKLSLMAFQDELTGLPNRRAFHEKMEQTLEEAKRNKAKFALLYLDIDKFKWVNDHLGHSAGDQLLRCFTERVGGVLGESDVFARQGGDEFLVLLPHVNDEETVKMIATRILASLQEEWEIDGHSFKTTSSIGIAVFPKDGESMEKLLSHADNALYKAKERGRNTLMMYR